MSEEIANLLELVTAGEWGNNQGTPGGVDTGVIRSANFTKDHQFNAKEIVVRSIEERKRQKKMLKHGDILIEKSGGSPDQPVGRVLFYDLKGEHTCSNFISILRPSQQVDPKFLYYSLCNLYGRGVVKNYQQQTTGIINLQLGEYLRETIYHPPLPEQKKIAEILSGIDKSISTLNASAKKFRELVSASEESTFSVFRKDDLERQAQVVHDDKEAFALGDIFEFRNGLNYSKANTGRGLRVVGVGHFKDYRTPKYELLGELSPGGLDFKSSLLEEGDFLFVRSNGNRLLIGRCLSIENIPADTPVAHSGFTIRARPKNQHSYTRNYIKQLLQSRVFRRSVAELGGGTNISNLSQDILADTIIALPSIQRQEKESSGLLAIQDLLDHTQRKLTQLQALKTSLQSDLLSGRKRVSEARVLEGVGI